jgi:hypothetical protein
MNRRHLTVLGLGLLVVLTGCLGGGGPSDEELNEDATYDWNTTANATIEISGDSYTSIYELHNDSHLNVYQRDVFNNREPISFRALKFRYPNGTVVNASTFEVKTNSERTRLEPPNRTGKIAFSVEQSGKNFRTPTFVDGSYEVILPPNTDVGIPILSHVTPGGYERERIDGQVHLSWDDLDSDTLVVEYYLDRDLLIFGGIFAILLIVAIVGGIYYWRQIRELTRRREEYGLDVDDEDDDPRDQGPPPGMG